MEKAKCKDCGNILDGKNCVAFGVHDKVMKEMVCWESMEHIKNCNNCLDALLETINNN